MIGNLRLCTVTAASLLLLASPPAYAQTNTAQLSGRVIEDETTRPIEGATVEILTARGRLLARVVTDAEGRFRATLPTAPGYTFRAGRIGFARVTTPVLWADDRNMVEVEIRLDPEAVLLAPLEVTAWARRVRPSPVTEGFRDRLASGLGYFFTRADIERRAPTYVTDMLASVPGVQLRSSGRGARRHIYMSRTGEHCQAQIFVDGFLLNGRSRLTADPDFTLDDAVAPGSVEGIEVYHGLATMPAQFLNPDSRCGAVVVWTRRGG